MLINALYFLQNEMCIYSFGCNPSKFVVDNELFFFRVRHLKIKEKQEPWRLPSRQAELNGTDRLSWRRMVIIRQ